MNKITEINDETTNGGEQSISTEFPYTATIEVRGTSDLLFHRWNSESVDAKAKAAKNSAAKKTDDLESFVYRDEKGFICIPGEYVRGSLINAARFKQDPRSPRKSAMDLCKAAIVSMTPLASVGKKTWDYEDRRRAVVQRNGITRTRPALKAGWSCTFRLMVILPEYVDQDLLQELVSLAGRVIGLADQRPTYGRFAITKFSVASA